MTDTISPYKQLYQDFPLILEKIKDGIECGPGWYPLLNKLCSSLQWNTDKNGYPQVVAAQVKEKFGTLRFYVDGGNDKQWGAIHFAESMSSIICEQCGIPGKTYTTGWHSTLCPEHAEQAKLAREQRDREHESWKNSLAAARKVKEEAK